MVLNPTLFNLLVKRFGSPTITNEGEAMTCRYVTGWTAGKPSLQIGSFGESYNVDCPFCGDSRHRLSINHRYGCFDKVTKHDNMHLVRCFNENCQQDKENRLKLKERIFGFKNRDDRRRQMVYRPGSVPTASAATLREIELPGRLIPLPGRLIPLPEQEPGHQARVYLEERGFDPDELSSVWGLQYCEYASGLDFMAQDRLVIPIIRRGVCVGWQARFIGDCDFKHLHLPKYVIMPGLPKGRLLYNHDLAKQQSMVVITEGPSDVWRVGPAGVALFGKQASEYQIRLLAKDWQSKPMIVLLDGDASVDARDLVRKLKPFVKDNLVRVALPYDRDPGDYQRDELWSIIRKQATEQGVVLPTEAEVSQPAIA